MRTATVPVFDRRLSGIYSIYDSSVTIIVVTGLQLVSTIKANYRSWSWLPVCAIIQDRNVKTRITISIRIRSMIRITPVKARTVHHFEIIY